MLAAFTARPAGVAILPFGARVLTLHLLVTFVPVLSFLAVGPFAAIITRPARAARSLSVIRGSGRRHPFGGRFSGFALRDALPRRRGLRLRPTRPTRFVRPAVGSSGRTPNFDKSRLLRGLAVR